MVAWPVFRRVSRRRIEPTTIIIPPPAARKLTFDDVRVVGNSFYQLVSLDGLEKVEAEAISVAPDAVLYWKGLTDPQKAFGDPENFGATHCSPVVIDGVPRLFSASFVVLSEWSPRFAAVREHFRLKTP